MGYAIANCLAKEGAEVILISGPVAPQEIEKNVHLISVVSAAEMFSVTVENF